MENLSEQKIGTCQNLEGKKIRLPSCNRITFVVLCIFMSLTEWNGKKVDESEYSKIWRENGIFADFFFAKNVAALLRRIKWNEKITNQVHLPFNARQSSFAIFIMLEHKYFSRKTGSTLFCTKTFCEYLQGGSKNSFKIAGYQLTDLGKLGSGRISLPILILIPIL